MTILADIAEAISLALGFFAVLGVVGVLIWWWQNTRHPDWWK